MRILSVLLVVFSNLVNAQNMVDEIYLSFEKPNYLLTEKSVAASQLVTIRDIKAQAKYVEALDTINITQEQRNVADFILEKMTEKFAHSARFVWKGTQQVTLDWQQRRLLWRDFYQHVAEVLENELGKRYLSLEIKPILPKERHSRFDKDVRLIVRTDKLSSLRKRTSVWVEVRDESSLLATVPAWFSVKAEQNVLIASRAIRKEQKQWQGELSYKAVNVAELLGQPLLNLEQTNGVWLKRDLKKGEVLTNALVELEPAVKRNQLIQVEYRKDDLVITASGYAKEHGYLGEHIVVQLIGSENTLSAQVVAAGKLKVGH